MIPIPSRKTLIRIVLAIVIIIAILIGINYLNTFQKVTVTYDTSLVDKLELYPAADTRNTLVPTGGSIQTIESGKEYTIKKGLYALKPSGAKIDLSLIKLSVGKVPVSMKLDIDYSATQLTTMLAEEQVAINGVINTSNPGIPKLYRINNGVLYHHGEWFATTLSYGGTETLRRDTLRLIAKKENGTWKVVTNPPQVILNRYDYTDVPLSIIQKANSIDLGLPSVIDLNQPIDSTHVE